LNRSAVPLAGAQGARIILCNEHRIGWNRPARYRCRAGFRALGYTQYVCSLGVNPMAKEPDKPVRRTILTGTAQPVTNSVERAQGFLKGHSEPSPKPSTKRNRRRREEPKDHKSEREEGEG
jgi:hypothetical protein